MNEKDSQEPYVLFKYVWVNMFYRVAATINLII